MRRVGLLLALLLLLSGCIESEARLVWHKDGSMDLTLKVVGEPALLDALEPALAAQGYRVERTKGELFAGRPLKAPGWDRVSGLLPGTFVYQDPSGVALSRTSYVFFEDYALKGRFVPLEVAGLPVFLAEAPFRFLVEAPFTPYKTNAERREGRVLVWQGKLGEPFEILVVYRLWYPERVAGGVLLLVLIGLVLWRRSRRLRAA